MNVFLMEPGREKSATFLLFLFRELQSKVMELYQLCTLWAGLFVSLKY